MDRHSSRSTFQGHSRSSKLPRFDRVLVASHRWLLITTAGISRTVVCSGISLCAWHSTGVSCRQPAADIRVRRPSSSSLCLHDYAAGAANSSCNSWRPRLSGGCGAGVEQSASTDQGRLVAVIFSTADKGPSVSAVVQLTSDHCIILFFKSDM